MWWCHVEFLESEQNLEYMREASGTRLEQI
jgi:hypothetical protein